MRLLIVFSFFHLVAINAVSAADSDVSCKTSTVETGTKAQTDRISFIGCFQNYSKWEDTNASPLADNLDEQQIDEISVLLLDYIQDKVSSSTSLPEEGLPQELIAAERYSKIMLTVLGNTLSRQEASQKSPLTPSADVVSHSPFNETGFEAFAPFAPMFDDTPLTPTITEDGVSWK